MLDEVLFRTLLGPNNIEFSITCLQSLLRSSIDPIRLEIFDDGNLKPEHIDLLETSLTNSKVILKSERDFLISEKLKSHPRCLKFRNSNVLAYKLFDTILFNDLDFFFIDSDVVFYKKFKLPPFPNEPIFMLDSTDSYNFRPIHFFQVNTPVFSRSNTGFMYFPAIKFDLDFIEKTLGNARLFNNIRHPWAEQTMWSFLAAKYGTANIFDPRQIVIASSNMKVNEAAIAIHFVKPFRSTIEQYRYLENSKDGYPELKLIKTSETLSFWLYTTRWMTRKFNAGLRRVYNLKKSQEFIIEKI